MLGLPMIWILVGIVVLIMGALAMFRMPALMMRPLGLVVLVAWIIVVISIFEYARLFDPWYDQIVINTGEIALGIAAIGIWVKAAITSMEKRFDDFKEYQRDSFARFEKHMGDKFNSLKSQQ